MEEAEVSHPVLIELSVRRKTLQIEIDVVEFLTPELQEQMKALSHMNIVVTWIPIKILQSLQIGILHEIRLHANEANREMTKVIDEMAQLQQ
jgi:hypothetical protein